ncbi:YxeA family protein [Enterococcus faecium]|uniref:YxeA family protein n=1 Tax=Enterococcus faecium TaxID=1352 RepID=UPI0012ABA5E2|nr:YxeA family protein [Enterococcus faecium]NRE83107.1 YxeA family protein [Enterococcus faecium]
MKKLIGVLVVLGIFLGGSFAAYHYFYGGEAYYTKITTNGEMSAFRTDNGEKFTTYTYKQAAYNKDGEKKQVTLHEVREHPLKMNTYLQLKVNPRKGVLSWEEIKASEVPKNAAEKIDQ